MERKWNKRFDTVTNLVSKLKPHVSETAETPIEELVPEEFVAEFFEDGGQKIGDTITPLKEPQVYVRRTPVKVVVDSEEHEEAGPVDGKRGRETRVKKPARFLLSPYRQVDTTLIKEKKKHKGKKAQSLTIGREAVNDEDLEEVTNNSTTRMKLDVYLGASGAEFFVLWSTNANVLWIRHRLGLQALDWNFWAALLGYYKSGWLDTQHILYWAKLLMEVTPSNARWMVMPVTTNLDLDEDISNSWALRASGQDDCPPWWDVDKVCFVINVPNAHWFLGEIDLVSWKITIYDSAKYCDFFKTFRDDGTFHKFGEKLLQLLDTIFYCDHFPGTLKRTEVMEFVEAVDVPQQTGGLGDCGVFVCMFLEMLASGVPLQLQQSALEAALGVRSRMCQILWATRL